MRLAGALILLTLVGCDVVPDSTDARTDAQFRAAGQPKKRATGPMKPIA
jgi:hypothetical protein